LWIGQQRPVARLDDQSVEALKAPPGRTAAYTAIGALY
jgi:hypothetical protein